MPLWRIRSRPPKMPRARCQYQWLGPFPHICFVWYWIYWPGCPYGSPTAVDQVPEGRLFNMQIHRADLKALEVIGAGQFGAVYLATQVRYHTYALLPYLCPATIPTPCYHTYALLPYLRLATIPMPCYPCLSSSKHHSLPYLCPTPVLQVVRTIRYHTYALLPLSFK